MPNINDLKGVEIEDMEPVFTDTPARRNQAVAIKDAPGKLESFVRGAAQDLSFGFADEMVGGLEAGYNSIFKGEDFAEGYQEARDESREAYSEAERENPISYGAGEWGGLIGSVLATGGGALAKKAVSSLAKGLNKKLFKETISEGAERVAKEALEEGVEKLGKEALGEGVEKVTKEATQEGTEKLAKEIAEEVPRDIKKYPIFNFKQAGKSASHGARFGGLHSLGMSEEDNLDGLTEDALVGALGGAVMAPIMSLGLQGASHLYGKAYDASSHVRGFVDSMILSRSGESKIGQEAAHEIVNDLGEKTIKPVIRNITDARANLGKQRDQLLEPVKDRIIDIKNVLKTFDRDVNKESKKYGSLISDDIHKELNQFNKNLVAPSRPYTIDEAIQLAQNEAIQTLEEKAQLITIKRNLSKNKVYDTFRRNELKELINRAEKGEDASRRLTKVIGEGELEGLEGIMQELKFTAQDGKESIKKLIKIIPSEVEEGFGKYEFKEMGRKTFDNEGNRINAPSKYLLEDPTTGELLSTPIPYKSYVGKITRDLPRGKASFNDLHKMADDVYREYKRHERAGNKVASGMLKKLYATIKEKGDDEVISVLGKTGLDKYKNINKSFEKTFNLEEDWFPEFKNTNLGRKEIAYADFLTDLSKAAENQDTLGAYSKYQRLLRDFNYIDKTSGVDFGGEKFIREMDKNLTRGELNRLADKKGMQVGGITSTEAAIGNIGTITAKLYDMIPGASKSSFFDKPFKLLSKVPEKLAEITPNASLKKHLLSVAKEVDQGKRSALLYALFMNPTMRQAGFDAVKSLEELVTSD